MNDAAPTPDTETLRAQLRDIVGDGNVLCDDDAASALVDWRAKFHGRAIAVVRPGTTAEVSAVLAWSHDNDVCVVTQGGNTGLSGGAQLDASSRHEPDRREAIVVSTQRMSAIEHVDTAGSTMTAQAGATIESMQHAAAEVGRTFAPDWGARGSATLGGGTATDAGGTNVLRYGNMRDQILGLEVVLADGTIWDGLRSLRKDSSGYDLKQLFVGSEGTLGIVTRAVVRLHAATTHQQSAMASLRSLDDLMAVFALANDVCPDEITAFELLPEVGVSKVCDVFDLAHPMTSRSEFSVLVKLASTRPVTDRLTEFLTAGTDAGFLLDAVVASTPDQERRLWMIRDELPPIGLYPHQAIGLKMDTAVPVAAMVDYHHTLSAIAAEVVPGSLFYAFGHVGDGNLHVMVLPVDDDQVEPFLAARDELVRRIDEATFAAGGTLSAEHGIGRELVERVAGQKPAVEWEMMRAVKAALDPQGRLNPGALFPAR